MARLRPTALLLALALAAGCATPPSEPGARWQVWTTTLGSAALPDGEFAVLEFDDPRATPGAGAEFADALGAALRDRGRATLSREWAADNLPAEGVVVVRGRLVRWRLDAERGWLVAEAGFTLSVDGEQRLEGSLVYEVLLTPMETPPPAEACAAALRDAMAGVLADELLEKVG